MANVTRWALCSSRSVEHRIGDSVSVSRWKSSFFGTRVSWFIGLDSWTFDGKRCKDTQLETEIADKCAFVSVIKLMNDRVYRCSYNICRVSLPRFRFVCDITLALSRFVWPSSNVGSESEQFLLRPHRGEVNATDDTIKFRKYRKSNSSSKCFCSE